MGTRDRSQVDPADVLPSQLLASVVAHAITAYYDNALSVGFRSLADRKREPQEPILRVNATRRGYSNPATGDSRSP